jgi:hypothetical protein
MPEEIVTRILRLPGYGVSAWETDEATGTLRLVIRQTAAVPYYVCSGCGVSVREIHSWTERRFRDLPWAPGKSSCASRCTGPGAGAAGCAPSGCRSSRARPATPRGWRTLWPGRVRRRRSVGWRRSGACRPRRHGAWTSARCAAERPGAGGTPCGTWGWMRSISANATSS